ncbi:MAG: histidine phosphatase family protein [Candidatus Woesearchaeota archaeon]
MKKKPSTTRLILVRHGETIANGKARVCGGWQSPLTRKGIDQAKKLAIRLKDESIDIIYTSNLIRARKTAAYIRRYHQKTPCIVESELRERYYGTFERKKVSAFYVAMQKVGKTRATFRPPRGESAGDVRKRAKKVLTKIISQNRGKTILIVAHGAFNTCAILYLLKKKNTEYVKLFQHNTAVTIINITGKKVKLHTLNCTKHLK